jgi:hypothetical protein
VKGKSNRWNSGTSNRRSNCSKNTNRSNSTCSRDSSQRTGGRPGGKILLRRESPNRSLNRPSLNEHCGTRSRRSNGKILAWIRLGCNTAGLPSDAIYMPLLPHFVYRIHEFVYYDGLKSGPIRRRHALTNFNLRYFSYLAPSSAITEKWPLPCL